MADMKWTSDQHNAIYADNGTVIVSAAAGSGKTAVLVKRVIEKITSVRRPCDIDELLIVTFTKAAAAQMREKIGRALAECIVTRPNDIRLLRQQILLPSAKICTIDSFCNDIVRSHIHETDLQVNYTLLDEGGGRMLRNEAYEEVVDDFYAKADEDFTDLVELFVSGSDDGTLQEVVYKLYDFSCAYPSPREWIERIGTRFQDAQLSEENGWIAILLDYLRTANRYCLSLAKYAYEQIRADEAVLEAYGDAFSGDISHFEKTEERLSAFHSGADWDAMYESIHGFSFDRLGAKKRGYETALWDNAKRYRNKYKEIYDKKIKTAMCFTEDGFLKDTDAAEKTVAQLAELTKAFAERFREKKLEQNAADFSDIVHTALNLLTQCDNSGHYEKTALAREYEKQFKEILIDEYQDTNMAQDLLFNAVSRNESNMFFVGDVKQSIYRFRQAMPGIFLQRRSRYTDYDGQTKGPARITLAKNFRSRSGITNWVNFLFSRIMSRDMGEIDYDEKERLVCGAGYPSRDDSDVELHLIDRSQCADTDASAAELESTYIADRIDEMLHSGMTVTESGAERPLRQGDICILLRASAARAQIYASALRDRGISVNLQDKGGLFETPEIKVFFSLLKVIDNPLQDIPLLSTLMSPVFGFTPDDVAGIRIGRGGMNLFGCICASAEQGDAKCSAFLEKLSAYRMMSTALTAEAFIRWLLEETGYGDMVLAMEDGGTRKENLALFQELARTVSPEEAGLSSFVYKLDKMCEQGAGLPGALKSSGKSDAVSIMTVHHSKGLEFPVCILAYLSGKFNDDSRKASLVVDSDSGVGLKGKDDIRKLRYHTVSHTAVKLKSEFSELSEELRVLYVAMTRAKEKLILVSTQDNLETKLEKLCVHVTGQKTEPFAVRTMGSYADWILTAALSHPDCGALRAYIPDVPAAIDSAYPCRLELKIVTEVKDKTENREPQSECAEEQETVLSDIREKVGYEYPYKALSSVLAKRGASEAMHTGGINRDFFASARPSFLNQGGLTPAQRGTAMHLFMQFADYSEAGRDIAGESDRLVEKGFLNPAERDSLDLEKLKRFFSSSLAQRMFRSEQVYREKKFIIFMSPSELEDDLPERFDDEKILVQGILDCAFEEDGKIVIVDYKTDQVKTPEELRERYKNQLRIYKKAVSECMDMEIKETVLYSFYLDTEISI